MKYEVNFKGGKNVKAELRVTRHGKIFIEKAKLKDIQKDEHYEDKFMKRLNKTLGKGTYKKLMKRLDKDFDI